MTRFVSGLLVFLLTGFLAVRSAPGGIVWVDPNDYNAGEVITPPFVTLSAVLGNTRQNPPDGWVLALPNDRPADNPRYSDLLFFGWHIIPPVDADEVAWRGKWANLQAVFDAPVSYVALDFYRNDFYGGNNPDEIGFVVAYDAFNNVIWNEWVYLEAFEDWTTVEISLPSPEIKKIVAGGVYVSKKIEQDILIQRLGYSVQPVPEPGTLVLLIGGMTTLGLVSRCRRKKGV
jgi:hypothetical protein